MPKFPEQSPDRSNLPIGDPPTESGAQPPVIGFGAVPQTLTESNDRKFGTRVLIVKRRPVIDKDGVKMIPISDEELDKFVMQARLIYGRVLVVPEGLEISVEEISQ